MTGRLAVAVATIAILGLGCGAPVAPTPTVVPTPTVMPQPTPTSTPSPWPSNRTESSQLMLQMSRTEGAPLQGGTFWPVQEFSLYDDGQAIYSLRGAPWNESLLHARLDAPQLAALLADAYGPGGLSTTRTWYDDVSFESTTYFFYYDGTNRPNEITVQGLGHGDADAPSAADRAKFLWLVDRLANFDNDITAGKAQGLGDYQPAQYRVWLTEPYDGMPVNAAWPWPDLTVDDFRTLPNTLGPSRLVSPEQAQAVIDLGIDFNLVVQASDGNSYQVTIRPMLPADYLITP